MVQKSTGQSKKRSPHRRNVLADPPEPVLFPQAGTGAPAQLSPIKRGRVPETRSVAGEEVVRSSASEIGGTVGEAGQSSPWWTLRRRRVRPGVNHQFMMENQMFAGGSELRETQRCLK